MGPQQLLQGKSLFFMLFFQTSIFPSIRSRSWSNWCQKISLGLNFSKMSKKVGKMHLRHLQPSRHVLDLSASHFGSVAPIGVIFGLQPRFRPKFFSPKISSISDQWLTRGGCFQVRKPEFSRFFQVFQNFPGIGNKPEAHDPIFWLPHKKCKILVH